MESLSKGVQDDEGNNDFADEGLVDDALIREEFAKVALHVGNGGGIRRSQVDQEDSL